jgi:hypothetical protein
MRPFPRPRKARPVITRLALVLALLAAWPAAACIIAERRRIDRRAGPASTWTTLGFVTVSVAVQATSEHAAA